MGLAEILSEDISVMAINEVEEITKLLHLSATNLFQLLENLLEWSILKRGNFEFAPQETSLNTIINNCIKSVLETAQQKNIVITMDLAASYVVRCDQKMTETIFRNLISNALKFTNNGGIIVIKAEPVSPDELTISVTDSGIGMNTEIIEKLFQLNEQSNRKGTDGESSSGLGLLICKDLVEKQGGRIWAESKENIGSTFHFTLKLVK